MPKLFHCSQVEGKNAGNPERTLTIVNESSSSAQRIDDDLAALREGEPQDTVPVIADDDFHDLYKRIDRAMYRSKHLGRRPRHRLFRRLSHRNQRARIGPLLQPAGALGLRIV